MEKRYYTLNEYCKKTYGEKLYKIAIDAGMTCPNRDGTKDTRGCIFCSAGGSGDFAVKRSTVLSIEDQIRAGLALFGDKKTGDKFIAYFQAYTNTYAPVKKLEALYREALDADCIKGISIATRADCLPKDVLSLLEQLKAEYPDKFIWVELGLQTVHEQTANMIRRGFTLDVFTDAVRNLQKIGIPVIAHVILGLPGETNEMMFETIQYINRMSVWGVKLQLLHVLSGTDLGDIYVNQKDAFHIFSKEEYLAVLIDCIEHLRPEIVIHRVTGDGPKNILLAPSWSRNKRDVLNSLHREMAARDAYQGRLFHEE